MTQFKDGFPFVFLGDKGGFKDLRRGGGMPLKLESAAKRLMEYWPDEYPTLGAAITELENCMQTPVHSDDVKSKKTTLSFLQIYSEMKEIFPFYIRVTAKGERQIYFVDDKNQATLVDYKDDDSVINSLMYHDQIWDKLFTYYMTSSLLEGHRDKIDFRTFLIKIIKSHMLIDASKRIKAPPKNFSWNPGEIAFKKFDGSLIQPGATPTWDEFTSRLDYPEIFKAWVFACFEPTNNIRQVMWITGNGNDGKSAVQKALRDIFGPDHVYDLKKNDENDKWFQGRVFGKGLVNYADCDNPHLLNNQAIKQLTGGDTTSIENKGADAFSGEIYAKLFISSNMPPKINPDLEAHVSRLIRLKLAPIQSGAPKDEGFKTRLIAEAYYFLYQARECYNKYINEGRDALLLPEELKKSIENECATDQFYTLLEFVAKNIEFGPEYTCKPALLNKRIKEFVTLEQFLSVDKAKFFQSAFEQKLNLLGIKMQNAQENGTNSAVYVGFKLIPNENFGKY